MKIAKILNNNIAIAVNDKGEDIIVMGCGVAYQKRYGDMIDESRIERMFTKSVPELSNKFEALIKEIPAEYLDAAELIFDRASLRLGKEFAGNLYLSLTDHIYFAAKRYHEGLEIHNRLLLETKMLYQEEFQAGMEAIAYLNQRFSLTLPEDEAAFIAMHFVNASMGIEMNETTAITKVIQQIRTIIRNYFQIEFDEESFDYYRMMTHLKFFAQRMVTGKTYDSSGDDAQLLQMVRNKYHKSYNCVERIEKFLLKEYSYKIAPSEQLYLTIHIERIRKVSQTKE